MGKHDVSVRRLHIGQLVTSVVSFQIRGRPVTNRFAFETLRHDHDAKTFGFARTLAHEARFRGGVR